MSKWEILATTVSILWTFFKTSGFLEMRRLAKLERLFQALEVGVAEAWKTVVKPWLESNPTAEGLPESVRSAAEEVAIKVATETDSVVKKFDCATIMATLKAAVEEAKRRGGK